MTVAVPAGVAVAVRTGGRGIDVLLSLHLRQTAAVAFGCKARFIHRVGSVRGQLKKPSLYSE